MYFELRVLEAAIFELELPSSKCTSCPTLEMKSCDFPDGAGALLRRLVNLISRRRFCATNVGVVFEVVRPHPRFGSR